MTHSDERPEKRRLTGEAPPATIPDDLAFSEVLPRLPVKTLMRFKCVCRAWRDAITGHAVARRHLELSSSSSSALPPQLLMIPREAYHPDPAAKSAELSFYRLLLGEPSSSGDPDVELVFEKACPGVVTHAIVPTHCDGLVAISTATGEVFVANPTTREFVALPPGTRSVRSVRGGGPMPAVALGYDSSREKYVVARYFYRMYEETVDVDTGKLVLEYSIGHEVFTLGSGNNNTWEVTDDPPFSIAAARPIRTREAFYWCTEHAPAPHQSSLLRFDLKDRAFSVVPFPPGTGFQYFTGHTTELAGKLCCVNPAMGSAFDVWVAEDGGGARPPEWSLRCRVDLDDDALGVDAFLPLAAVGNEIMIAVDYKFVYVYDERFRSVRCVVDMEWELEYERLDGSVYEDADLLQHHVVPYVESVVSIRGGGRA